MDALTNLLGTFAQMLENQEHTDITFKLCGEIGGTQAENPEIFCAHKLILEAASPVFKIMFTENWRQEGKPIEIKDIDANLFKMFISTIYTNYLFEDVKQYEVIAGLYMLSHMYETCDVMDMVLEHMISCCNAENVILFANLAWTYKDKQLKNICKKTLAKYATQILAAPDFFTAKPNVINSFYSMDALNITSEDELLLKLDEYCTQYIAINDNPDFMIELKTAVESIRLLMVSSNVFECLNVLMLKDVLYKRLQKLRDPLKFGPVPSEMKRCRQKVTLLSCLPIHLLQALYKNFRDESCPDSNCQTRLKLSFYSFTCPRDFQQIYNKYKHTNLMDYSDEEIEKILCEFEKLALYQGRSEYNMFVGYKDYLNQ